MMSSRCAAERSGEEMGVRRALHFVFKVGDRARTARFYRELLGMSVSAARGAGELSGSAALSPEETPRAVGGG